MSNPENKIDNTFNRAMDQLNSLQKAFAPGKQLEKAIMAIGGDTTYLADIAETLSEAYDSLEQAHHGAMAHLDESSAPSRLHEGVLDGDDEDGFLARSQLYFLAKDAIGLHGMIDDQDDLEPWVQAKISLASKDMDAVRRYTEYKAMEPQAPAEPVQLPVAPHPEMDPQQEESTLEEGTWKIPDTDEAKAELAALMQHPIAASEAVDTLYHLIGNDDLADSIDEIAETEPDSDVRFLVKNFLQEWDIDIYPVSEAIRTIRSASSKMVQMGQGVRNKKDLEEESTFDSSAESKNDLQTVANTMFKSALTKAKKKANS